MTSKLDKPKSKAHQRWLTNRDPKLIENDKKCLFLRGGNTSDLLTKVMRTLYQFKKQTAVQFHQKNMLRPFEDPQSLEFFSKKNDTSQFIFGSHNKKRPHNLTFGRLFNYSILDMFELGVLEFNFPEKIDISANNKPVLSFTGSGWTENPEFERLRNILTDIFSLEKADHVLMNGFEHVLNFEISDNLEQVCLNCYKVDLKKSGTNLPRVELKDTSFNIKFQIRRQNLGSTELWKKSLKKPKEKQIGQIKPKAKKNFEFDDLGFQYGRIHLEKQDFNKVVLYKRKAMKRKMPELNVEEEEDTQKAAKID